MNTNYINLKRRTNNAKGVWNFELLSKYTKMIDTCVYQGKRYVLYLDYSDILILVCVTDMWYIRR